MTLNNSCKRNAIKGVKEIKIKHNTHTQTHEPKKQSKLIVVPMPENAVHREFKTRTVEICIYNTYTCAEACNIEAINQNFVVAWFHLGFQGTHLHLTFKYTCMKKKKKRQWKCECECELSMHESCINMVLTFCLDGNRNDGTIHRKQTQNEWNRMEFLYEFYEQKMAGWLYSIVVQRISKKKSISIYIGIIIALFQMSIEHRICCFYDVDS